MTLDELLLALPFNYDYFKRLAEFYVEQTNADPLTVDFSGTPLTGAAPTTVVFTSTTTGSPTEFFWDFGDGGTSTEENPSYEYAAAGDYSVVCIVQDSVGVQAVAAKPDYITITPAAPLAATEGETDYGY